MDSVYSKYMLTYSPLVREKTSHQLTNALLTLRSVAGNFRR